MIPFNRPTRAPEELALVREALENGAHLPEAKFGDQSAEWLSHALDVRYATLTPSCTAALELAALALDIQPGDEVIVPSFTFTSTANAFLLRGARIVFADAQADTLCIDPEHVAKLITPRTRAIVAMHYAGISCDMDRLMSLANAAGVPVIEDAAHALFGRYKGRSLGTIGAMGTYSFHRTKNLTCGEGGALVTNEAHYSETAEIVREKGTNRSQFMRGLLHKYEWVRSGSSYVIADLLAAQLLAQLRASQEVQAKRARIWLRYQRELADWAAREGVRQPHIPDGCEPAWHLYHLVMPTSGSRDRFLDHLRSHDIGSAFHYIPLHLTPFGQQMGGRSGDAPVTEKTAPRLVRLPFFTDLTEDEQSRVIEVVWSFSERATRAA